MCTPRRARWTGLIVTVVSLFISLPNFFELALTADGKTCSGFSGTQLISILYTWFMTSVSCFIPFSMLLVMNSIIINAVRERDTYMKTKSMENIDNKVIQSRQLTAMLLVVTFTFLIVTLPTYIRLIYYDFNSYTDTPTTYAVYVFIAHSTQKLFTTNNAINFYLYCMTGAKFRHDLMTLFCSQNKPADLSSNALTMSSIASKHG